MNLGRISVAAPKAASSKTARYSSTARLVAGEGSPFSPSTPFVPVRVGLDQAGINCKTFAADQTLVDAAAQGHFEQLSQQITVAEPACLFFEKVEWSGTSPSSPRRQNHR